MGFVRLVLFGTCLSLVVTACASGRSALSPEVRAVPSVSASTTPSPAVSARSERGHGLDLASVDWNDVTAPGAACLTARAIHLHHGYAVLHHRTRREALLRRPYSLEIDIKKGVPDVTYGDLQRPGVGDAAVSMFCSDQSGVAEGILLYSVPVYSGASGHLRLLGLITPQIKPGKEEPVTLLGPPRFRRRTIIVTEDFYGSKDDVCCPSGRATTVWVYRHGRLTPRAPIVTTEPR
jgi:hypothetical protein